MLRIWVVLALVGSVARADVVSPEVGACMGKSAGDACDGGACVTSTCSRSRPGPDGKIEFSAWDCLQCTAGASAKGDTVRLIAAIGSAVLVIGLGIWLARKRMKAVT